MRNKQQTKSELESDLERSVDGEVRFDKASRGLYATDGSNYRQVPMGVVIPKTTDAVVETVRLCRKHEAPILARGGGTALAGQGCNEAVVIDFSKYLNRVIEIDRDQKIARVQPGTILDDLRAPAQSQYNLTFGPDPATHTHCTFGGMLGNNSCGIHSVMAGRSSDNVVDLEVLTYDGMRMKVRNNLESDRERLSALPKTRGKIVLHNHCHQKAVLDPHALRKILRQMGFEIEEPWEGCCGMAGAFGMEEDKYEISMKIAEMALLPAVRAASPLTYIVADGFSCRSQIQDGTGRKVLHSAELIASVMTETGKNQGAER